MAQRLIVLDFDGTVTDGEAEGKAFTASYLGDISKLTGLEPEETLSLARDFEAMVMREPDKHHWNRNGYQVCPGTVDPYVRIRAVVSKIFDHAGYMPGSLEDRERLFEVLYGHHYESNKGEPVFLDGALHVVKALQRAGAWIVTNSATEPVQNKLRVLQDRSDVLSPIIDRVRGSAKKFMVGRIAGFGDIRETMDLPGLKTRPVQLHRPAYHSVLRDLHRETETDWENTVVIGDIFELDLALPLEMGARVYLVRNEFTPHYEIRYVDGHERGRTVESLGELLTALQQDLVL